MINRLSLFLLFAGALALIACSSDNDDTADTGGTQDVGEEDTGFDVSEDVTDGDSDSDTDTEDAGDGPVPCGGGEYECADDERCIDGYCTSIACKGPNDWTTCTALLNQLGPDRGRYATCTNKVCRESCFFDEDCPGDEICTDFGECQLFEADLTLVHPHGPATGDLQAGVGVRLLNYPMGTPQGGYGERAAANDGRYAQSLRASVGELEGLYAKAVVLDNGERHIMFVRLPVIFTDMVMHENLARALEERTGKAWRDSLVVSSTHTHSGPCRHWHLPHEAAAPLGSFGIGEFSQFFFDRLMEVIVDTAMDALDNMQPAQIGWKILEAYDTDDHVGRDRWNEAPPFDDNRALLIRIDDMDDTPIAAMVSYAAHGTDNTTEYLTGDGIGRSEFAFEDALGREFGRYIPTLFVNQNSGTMGPAGGAIGHAFPLSMDRLGWAFVDKTFDDFLDIETVPELTLNTNTMRFYISYDLLGYDRNEFAANRIPRPFGGEYHYGGLSCVGPFGGDEDYETHDTLANFACAGALHFLLYNAPPTTLTRSQIMTFELNGLTSVVIPGELSMELSWQMLRRIRDDFGVDPLTAWTFGYANDHLFYLLPTNLRGELPPFPGISTPMAPDDYPDYSFSFFQGGYETGMSAWGPNQGDYLVDRVAETYHQMMDENFSTGRPEPVPPQYAHRDEPAFPRQATPASVVGTITAQPPATIERLEAIEFSWMGGDPEAEMPQMPVVTLEAKNDDGDWEAVLLPSTLPYTNFAPKMITRLRQEAPEADFEWVIRWEELQDFPTGEYRFTIAGHYFNDSFERLAYNVTTDVFDFVATTAIEGWADVQGDDLRIFLGFPVEERASFVGPSVDPGRIAGNFRMRDPFVPTGWNAPVDPYAIEITISDDNGFEQTFGTADGTFTNRQDTTIRGRTVPASFFTLDISAIPGGTYNVSVSVVDEMDNSGEFTLEVEL